MELIHNPIFKLHVYVYSCWSGSTSIQFCFYVCTHDRQLKEKRKDSCLVIHLFIYSENIDVISVFYLEQPPKKFKTYQGKQELFLLILMFLGGQDLSNWKRQPSLKTAGLYKGLYVFKGTYNSFGIRETIRNNSKHTMIYV